MTCNGGLRVSMVRICTGEVWVRSNRAVGDKEGILHVARRMIFGNIERFEVMVIVFDIRAAGDLETHARKNIDDLVDDQRQRMGAARAAKRVPGKRDIDLFVLERLGLWLLILDRRNALVQALLQSSRRN